MAEAFVRYIFIFSEMLFCRLTISELHCKDELFTPIIIFRQKSLGTLEIVPDASSDSCCALVTNLVRRISSIGSDILPDMCISIFMMFFSFLGCVLFSKSAICAILYVRGIQA